MTDQERRQYNQLSREGQRHYDQLKNDHPYWSHSQLYAATVVYERMIRGIENGGDINKGDFWKDILAGARRWLSNLPNIASDVLSALDNAIYRLGVAMREGIEWLGGKIGDFLEWLGELF